MRRKPAARVGGGNIRKRRECTETLQEKDEKNRKSEQNSMPPVVGTEASRALEDDLCVQPQSETELAVEQKMEKGEVKPRALRMGDLIVMPRTQDVILKGIVIPPISDVVRLYPELEASRWWIDQTEDMYLSVFYGIPSSLGVKVGERFFGMAAWRVGLRARFQLECPYEGLQRFSRAVTGQQKNFLVAAVTIAQTRDNAPQVVSVAGSKMGLDSGLWHSSFDQMVETFHPGSTIEYYDYFEEDSEAQYRGMTVRHHRAAYKPPEGETVLIDDMQISSEHVPYRGKLPRYYSLKKQGMYFFCVPEIRFFSGCIPAKYEESYASCHCWQCRMVSLVADRYGGWPVWERMRSYLARLGPVCESSTMLQMETQVFEASQKIRSAQPLTEKEQKLPWLPAVRPATELHNFCSTKVGAVYAYHSEWEGIPHRRGEPVEFVVTDRERVFSEEGLPPIILTKTPMSMIGYSMRERRGEYYCWYRDKKSPPAQGRRVRI